MSKPRIKPEVVRRAALREDILRIARDLAAMRASGKRTK